MLISFEFAFILGIINLVCSMYPVGKKKPRPLPLTLIILAIVAFLVTDWVSSPANKRSPYLPATPEGLLGMTALCLALALAPHPVFRTIRKIVFPLTPWVTRSNEKLLRHWFAQYGPLEMFIHRSAGGASERVTLTSFRHLRRVLAERCQPNSVAEIHAPDGQVVRFCPTT